MIEFERFILNKNTNPIELAHDIADHVHCNVMEAGTLMQTGAYLYNSESDINPLTGYPAGYYIGTAPGSVIVIYAAWWGGSAQVEFAHDNYVINFDCASGSGGWCFEANKLSTFYGPRWFAGFGEDLDNGSSCGFYCRNDGNYWCKNEQGSNDFGNNFYMYDNDSKCIAGTNIIAPLARVKSKTVQQALVMDMSILQDTSQDLDNRFWKTFTITPGDREYIAPTSNLTPENYVFMECNH